MMIIKFLLKTLLLPVWGMSVLVMWIGLFLNSISATIFGILSTLIWVLTLVSLMFGQATGAEAVKMLILGFICFIIPYIGGWFIERIVMIRCILGDYLHS